LARVAPLVAVIDDQHGGLEKIRGELLLAWPSFIRAVPAMT
jgi:hypothetical protein